MTKSVGPEDETREAVAARAAERRTARVPEPAGDEIRRQLRDTERRHQGALVVFRAALDRAFDPGSGVDPSARAELVGLPTRRGFLQIGGLAIATSAILVACSGGTSDVAAPNGTSSTAAGGAGATGGSTSPAATTDATLVLTAESIEQLAIATYQHALDSGLLKTGAAVDIARHFQSQHRDHAGLLAGLAKQMGQTATGRPNPYLDTNVVQPAIAHLVDERSVLALALALETAAAQTYTLGGGVLSVPALRQAVMSIGGIEARHMAVLNHVLGSDPVPTPFLPTDQAAPRASDLAPSGPVGAYPATVTTTTSPAG